MVSQMTPETFEAERLKLVTGGLRRLRIEQRVAWGLLVLNAGWAIVFCYLRCPWWGLWASSHVLWVSTIAMWIATIRRRQREIEQERAQGEIFQRHMAAIVKGLGELHAIQAIVGPKGDPGLQRLQ